MIGTSVSHYRILSKLGAGGMGEVFVAEDEHLARRVAIKFPFAKDESGDFRRRFQREARAASSLTHPNIARVYDYGEAPDGRPFLVMELVEGTPLKQVLRQGRLEPEKAGEIVAGVLRGLGEAHAHGLVHRDIKPANVMLCPSGEVKILDFGMAKEASLIAIAQEAAIPQDEAATSTGITVAGMVAGTPAYMSPEQARGGVVDARSDLFSTGLMLYQCLTGVAPFSGSSGRDVLQQVLTVDPVPVRVRVPELDKGWDRVVARALQKESQRRYGSAGEMLADVEAVEASHHSRSSVTVALVGSRRRAASTGLVAAAVVIAAILLVRGARQHTPSPEAAQFYQRGAVALRDGTYYAAARMLQKAVDLDRDFALAHARLAEAAGELDDSARASSEMLAALPQGSGSMPGGIPGLYIDAVHRTLTRDFAGAAKAYRQLADKGPAEERAAALVDLGRVYEKNSETDQALGAYREALARDPQNAAAHLRVGTILGRQRDANYAEELDRAFALYQALSNTEGQAEVLFQRGLLLSPVDPAGARVALEKSRELARVIPSEQQDIAATLQLSNVAYLGGDVDGASRMAADGVARAQRAGMNYLAARGLVDLGQTKLGRRDYAGAEASFRQSLELSRRYAMRRTEARALFYLANLHQVAGPKEDALTEAAPAYEYFHKAGFRIEAVQCLLVMARAHRDLGRGKEAIAGFQQALAAARTLPDPVRALQAELGLAGVFLNHGRWPEAAAQFERARQSAALNDRDNVPRALAGLGSVQWRLGRFGDAEQTLAQLPRDNRTLYLKAEIALARGHNAEATALARRVFEDPQRAQSAQCIAGLALARSAHAAEGQALCEPAVAGLLPKGDRFAVMEARMYLAEILLALGQDAPALVVLGQVAGTAAAVEDRETEWRAWALRARGLKHGGDSDGAGQAARKASEVLGALGWDAGSLQGYASRPDIGVLQRELRGR